MLNPLSGSLFPDRRLARRSPFVRRPPCAGRPPTKPCRCFGALHRAALVLTASLAATPVQSELLAKSAIVAGTRVQYKVVLPNGYDRAQAYPAILAFGGGPQNMATVDRILDRNFRAEAERRGYLVIAPAAPDGKLFYEHGAYIFPAFLKMILADYKILDSKFHVAGSSNGGIAAFHVAAAHPQYFRSVTAFPGFMWQADQAKLKAISTMCVYMYVGERDEYRWHDEMKAEADYLRAIGSVARYSVEKGQPHRLETLAGDQAGRLFEGFEAAGKGCGK